MIRWLIAPIDYFSWVFICLLDNVISSFPQRQDASSDNPDRFDMTDIFESVVRNLKNVRSATDLGAIIIQECASVFCDPTRYLQEDFQFFDMFENSIGKVVTIISPFYQKLVLLKPRIGRWRGSLLRSLYKGSWLDGRSTFLRNQEGIGIASRN
jgi:hypothetical protein